MTVTEKMLAKKFKNKPFSLKEALQIGVSKYHMKKLLDQDVVFKLSRGIYQFTEVEFSLEEQFKAATMICGKPSAICLVSALEYYSLTDLISGKTWVMVPNTKKVMNRQVKLYRTRSPQWGVGIQKHKGFWITSLERTLVDCLVLKKIVGSTTGISAMKEAIVQKHVKLHNIVACAKKMGVLSKVSAYIEALA